MRRAGLLRVALLLTARCHAINVFSPDEWIVASILSSSNAMNIVVTTGPAVRPSKRMRLAIWSSTCILSGLSLVVAVLWGVTYLPGYLAYRNYEPQEGDVIFQSLPFSRLVNAIEGATRSPYSHCGIVAKENDRWVVHEAFGAVGATPLRTFLKRGRNEAFDVYRWRPEFQRHVPQVLAEVRNYRGRPYDERYRLDDKAAAIYCSELIYLAYRAASHEPPGKLVTLGELRWQPYVDLIERIERAPPPLDREIITPRNLAAAEQLERIYSYGFSN
jgi:hypothetical protein